MKKIMLSIVALFFFGALSSFVKGQNTHAIVPQPRVDRDYEITSSAYTNYIDHNTGAGYFISVEVENKNALTVRRLDNCLRQYEEQYRRSLPWIRSVHDVLQVSETYSEEYYRDRGCIAFCGQYRSFDNDYGTVFIADSRLSLTLMRSYIGFKELYSMVEIPGKGYVICGRTHDDKGMYMYIDYRLNPIVSYQVPAVLKHVTYDDQLNRLLFAGIQGNELVVYGMQVQPYYVANPAMVGSVAYTYPSAQWFDNVKVLPWYDNDNIVMLFSSAELDPRINNGHVNNGLIAFVEFRQYPWLGTSHFFFAPQIDADRVSILRDVSWHDRKIFHMLMDYKNVETGIQSSMLVEPDLEYGIWKGAKIRNHDSEGLLRMHQMDIRRDCSRLSIGGYEDYPGGYSRAGNPRHSRYVDMKMPLQAAGIGSDCEEAVEFDYVYVEPVRYTPREFVLGDMREFTPQRPDLVYYDQITKIMCEGACIRECVRSAAQENSGDRYGMMEGETMQVSESIVVKAEAITLTSSDYMQYWILDASGRELSYGAATRNDIPLNTLKAGVYILRLQKADGSFEHHKFVKP